MVNNTMHNLLHMAKLAQPDNPKKNTQPEQ